VQTEGGWDECAVVEKYREGLIPQAISSRQNGYLFNTKLAIN
jgi:hypothetical protein